MHTAASLSELLKLAAIALTLCLLYGAAFVILAVAASSLRRSFRNLRVWATRASEPMERLSAHRSPASLHCQVSHSPRATAAHTPAA